MEMTSVSSSNVASVGYDYNSATLRIQFHNGSTYDYYSVPEYHYTALLNASSVGTYLNEYIKKGGFAYSRV